MKFTSTMEESIEKHGKLVKLGVINKDKEQALIAATIFLAFHAAVTDIYKQIKSQCEI